MRKCFVVRVWENRNRGLGRSALEGLHVGSAKQTASLRQGADLSVPNFPACEMRLFDQTAVGPDSSQSLRISHRQTVLVIYPNGLVKILLI